MPVQPSQPCIIRPDGQKLYNSTSGLHGWLLASPVEKRRLLMSLHSVYQIRQALVKLLCCLHDNPYTYFCFRRQGQKKRHMMIFNKLLWQGMGRPKIVLLWSCCLTFFSTFVAACCYVLIYVQLCSAHSATQHCLGGHH